MILDFSKNATIARIRTFYGKRITTEQYRDLASKKSVEEAAEYLKKNTHYATALANIDTNSIHRGFLEDILRKEHFNTYVKFCKFQQLNTEEFYKYFIVWLEIVEILNRIRHINADTNDEYIIDLPSFLINKASFDLIEMAKAKNFRELLGVLRNTPYYNILKNKAVDENGKVDFNLCEMDLRTYYLKWLINIVEKHFKGQSKEKLRLQIMTQIDLINIINAYRMKSIFHASNDEVRKNVLPYHGRISVKQQNELIESDNVSSFLSILSKTIYGKQLDNITECTDSIQFEKQISKLRFNLAKRALLFSENAAVSLYSAIYIFEVEVDNITRIVEGIRYGKDSSYMESLIIT